MIGAVAKALGAKSDAHLVSRFGDCLTRHKVHSVFEVDASNRGDLQAAVLANFDPISDPIGDFCVVFHDDYYTDNNRPRQEKSFLTNLIFVRTISAWQKLDDRRKNRMP